MGLRETMNRNPGIVMGVVIVAILIAGYFIVQQFRGSSGGTPATSAYFSDDDGKTYFKDDITKLAPFDHGGKEALRAYVYSCNGKPFVACLERLTPELKAEMVKARETAGTGKPPQNVGKLIQLSMSGRQVRKPGETNWVQQASPQGSSIMTVKCTDGSAPEAVTP